LSGKVLGEPASQHGESIDLMIEITTWVTGLVFVATQIALFWYAFKYQESDKRKAYYYPHNNKLEIIWTAIPAVVLTGLVGLGLFFWFKITGDAPKDAQVIEVTGKQFNWEFRYPGKDQMLGKKYFKNVSEKNNNPLGQIWDDPANRDDIYTTGEMHAVVGKPVKLVIYAKDVIHDVGLAHFRMKMDAVPGTPTTMWFTPKFTTREMREKYGPDFNYEISCDQMCGAGHYSMRGTIVVESQAEFNTWLAGQSSQYTKAHPAPKPAVTADSTGGSKQDSSVAVLRKMRTRAPEQN
jgi:cytochrome c oxidase subunit II